jgi:hypothetical protein
MHLLAQDLEQALRHDHVADPRWPDDQDIMASSRHTQMPGIGRNPIHPTVFCADCSWLSL